MLKWTTLLNVRLWKRNDEIAQVCFTPCENREDLFTSIAESQSSQRWIARVRRANFEQIVSREKKLSERFPSLMRVKLYCARWQICALYHGNANVSRGAEGSFDAYRHRLSTSRIEQAFAQRYFTPRLRSVSG